MEGESRERVTETGVVGEERTGREREKGGKARKKEREREGVVWRLAE